MYYLCGHKKITMTNNLPTAKDFLIESKISGLDADKIMIEFAKLHVEAALKSVSELEETNGTQGCKIYPDSILNAYPLANIQ
jgi:hypothetical protein